MSQYLLYLILLYIFSFLLGYIIGKVFNGQIIYGVIVVDDDEQSYFFKLNGNDIQNHKYKKVTFTIQHKNSSQK